MSRTLALLPLIFSLGIATNTHLSIPIETVHPVISIPSDTNPVPGETVTITVGLSAPASQDGVLSISSTVPSNYSTMPASVPVNVGDTSESFNVVISSAAAGPAQVTVSNSYGSATATMTVSPEKVLSASELLNSLRF